MLLCKKLSFNHYKAYAVAHDSAITVQYGFRTSPADPEKILLRQRSERANKISLHNKKKNIEAVQITLEIEGLSTLCMLLREHFKEMLRIIYVKFIKN